MRPAHRLTTSSLVLALALALAGFVVPSAITATDSAGSGHLHLTGDAAAAFVVPRDVSAVASWTDQAHDLEYTRYQQFARPFGVHVDGAQLTVVKRGARQVLVIGSHFAGLRVIALPSINALRAIAIAAATSERFDVPPDVAELLTHRTELRFDPVRGRLFQRVESGAPGVALFHEVDAQTGAVIASWNAIESAAGDGTGVKGDTKHLSAGPAPDFGDLTSQPGGPQAAWKMRSEDGRFETYTANGTKNVGLLVSDADDLWNATNQRAAVDAQYYAALTATFYKDRFDYDLFAQCAVPTAQVPDPVFESGIRSVVHYDPYPNDGQGYANAFWEPFAHYMVYGDGDSQTRAMSGAQDIVTHELTHAVTQCRAALDYFAQSGALNEAFSDIMAISAEWDFEEDVNAPANCRLAPGQTECADWLLGEDAVIDPQMLAFRDFEDPITRSDPSQPSHYDDRVFPSCNSPSGYNDNCGVHYNSGIANHAFYLLVNGGRNARCSGPTDPQADCDVAVPGIGLAHAEQIFFAGFGMLSNDATFCDARETTLAAADAMYPGSVADHVGVELAWAAVGRNAADCPPLPSDFSISVASPVVAAAAGGNGALTVNLTRGSQDGDIDFNVEYAGPISPPSFDPDPSVTPNNTTELALDVQANAADGVYPLLISASDGSTTHYTSAALVVDSADPDVEVGRARFVSGVTVGLDGKIKLRIDWSASDEGSGVTTAELDHSSSGLNDSWSAIFGPAAPTGLTDYDASAGPHHYQVVGTDVVGNSSTSSTLVTSLTAAQENAVGYTKTWTKFGTGTTWGTTRFAKRRGASATYTFNGTDVVWVAQRGPKRGKAYVYLDGVRTTVNLYASSLSERRVVFIGTGLAAGQHTLKIVCRGTSGRPRVDVDGFFVLNQ